MSKLNTYVHVHDEDGISHAFGPGDTVPEWAEARITNPKVWVVAPTADGGEVLDNLDGTISEFQDAIAAAVPGGSDDPAPDEGSGDDTDELPEGDITEAWTVKQLRAYAKSEGIELGGVTAKADILAKLAE